MNRPVPHIEVRDIVAGVILDPGGHHQFKLAVPSNMFGMTMDLSHLDQLETAIAKARAVMVQADGGPDFYNRKFIPIEVKS